MTVDRRAFLERVVWTSTGLVSVTLGGVAGGYLFGGARQTEAIRWIPLIPLADLIPGQPVHLPYRALVPDAWRTVWLSGSVWLVPGQGESDTTIFDPRCTHMGCPYKWQPGEGVFKCGCHGGVFDIEGRVLAGPPPRPLDRLDSRVVNGELLVAKGGPGPSPGAR